MGGKMTEISQAIRRGVHLATHKWWKWLQWPVGILAISSIVASPWGLDLIDPMPLRILAWTLFLVVIMITAICVGLTPYWGQQEIMKDKIAEKDAAIKERDAWIKNQENIINEWRNKANTLENIVNRLGGGKNATS